LLKADLAADPNFESRFRQEAQAAARMAHPTIVRVYDAGEEITVDNFGVERRMPFIVMELVRGRVLRDLLHERRLSMQEALDYTDGVLTALEFSHRAGVIHRDIKSANVMITESGSVKVMDFGIARALGEGSMTQSHTNGILGTAQYFSPEQARGETVDARTDLYSTGVLLYEMLAGRPPFTGESAVSVAYQHVSEPVPAPSQFNRQVSPMLDQVVLTALAKDRSDRFQSAEQFRDALHAAISDQSDGIVLPPTAPIHTITDVQAAEVSAPLSDAANLADTKVLDPFDQLMAEAAKEATTAINTAHSDFEYDTEAPQSKPVESTDTEMLEEGDNPFAELGVKLTKASGDAGGTIVADKDVKNAAGLLWGIGTGAGVLFLGLIVWLAIAGASLFSPGGTDSGIKIANVVGMTYDNAFTTLTAQGLLVDKQFAVSDTVLDGNVISTDPTAGTSVGNKTTITVYVSTGKKLVLMPDLTGMTEKDATAALTAAGLTLGTITQQNSADIAANLVISADQLPNSQIPAGTIVNVVTSNGLVLVPDVRNLDINAATSALTAADVGLKVQTEMSQGCTGTLGTTVVNQSIDPNTTTAQGSTVILFMNCVQ
jgi:serine/threonine-protein kinase